MPIDIAERPNRIPWPPLIFLAAAAVAFALGRVVPLGYAPPLAVAILGWLLVAAGVGLDLWAMATMARARTNILPHRAAGRLVTCGPFAFTRNPIYVGNTLLFAGFGVATGRLWFVVFALVAAALTERLAIRREEAHLAAKFGADWRDYSAATPRWLGPVSLRRPASR